MNTPDNLQYTKDHEWARIAGEVAEIGITDFAQSELGDIIFIEFPEPGQILTKDDPFGTIEAVKTVADLYAPLSGEVLEVNSVLEDSPENVNQDPYGQGWLMKVKLSDSSETDDLMTADEYRELIG